MLARTCLSACLLALSLAPVTAQDLDPRVKSIAPYLDERVAGVFYINFKKIDLPVAVDRILKLAPAGSEQIEKQVRLFLPAVLSIRTQLAEAGVNDAFAIAIEEPENKESQPFFVLPVEPGKDPQNAITVIKNFPAVSQEHEYIAAENAVVIGMPGTKDLIAGFKSARTAEFSYCMKLGGDTAFQFIMVPTKATLQNLDKRLESVPEGPAKEALQKHGAGIRAMIATANLPPNSAIAVFAKLKDEATASAILQEVNKGLEADEIKQLAADPTFGRLIKAMTPKQDKEILKIALTDSNGGTQAIADAVKFAWQIFDPSILVGIRQPGAGPQGLPPGVPPGVRPPPGVDPSK